MRKKSIKNSLYKLPKIVGKKLSVYNRANKEIDIESILLAANKI